MARFIGNIGYAEYVDKGDGVFAEKIVERRARGYVTRVARRWETTENLNDDLVMSHEFSIVMDAYALQNFVNIRYVVWGGARWRVNYIEARRPRLALAVGKVYNGPAPEAP